MHASVHKLLHPPASQQPKLGLLKVGAEWQEQELMVH